MNRLRVVLVGTLVLYACTSSAARIDSVFREPEIPTDLCAAHMANEACKKEQDKFISTAWGEFAKACAQNNGYADGYTCYICTPPAKAKGGKCQK